MREILNIVEATEPAINRLPPNFWKWFGDSVLRDGDEPMILFHGGRDVIESFSNKKMIWASVNSALANDYAAMRDFYDGSGNVIPLFMRITKPFDADRLLNSPTVKSFIREIEDQSNSLVGGEVVQKLTDLRIREESGPHYFPQDFWYNTSSFFGIEGNEIIRELLMSRFDGIRYTENGHETYGVFDPRQAKSIFNFEYNQNSTNISESKQT